MALFSKKNRDSTLTVAIIDISSLRAGGSVVQMAPGHRPRVMHHIAIPLFEQASHHFASLVETSALHALEQVLVALKSMHRTGFDAVYCFIGDPWVEGEFRTVTLEKKAPFLITSKVLDAALLDDYQKLSDHVARRQHARGGPVRVLDRKTNWVALNGYPIREYEGKQAFKVDIGTYWSILPESFAQMLEKRLRVLGPTVPLLFHSLHYATLFAVQSLAPQHTMVPVSLLTIHGLSSELFLLGHQNAGSGSLALNVPIGARAFYDALAEDFSLTAYSEVRSLLRLSRDHLLSRETEEKLHRALKRGASQWVRAIESAWSAALALGPLPRTCFYSGETMCMPYLVELLKESAFIKTHIPGSLRFVSFDETILPGRVVFDDGVIDSLGVILAFFSASLRHNGTV